MVYETLLRSPSIDEGINVKYSPVMEAASFSSLLLKLHKVVLQKTKRLLYNYFATANGNQNILSGHKRRTNELTFCDGSCFGTATTFIRPNAVC